MFERWSVHWGSVPYCSCVVATFHQQASCCSYKLGFAQRYDGVNLKQKIMKGEPCSSNVAFIY